MITVPLKSSLFQRHPLLFVALSIVALLLLVESLFPSFFYPPVPEWSKSSVTFFATVQNTPKESGKTLQMRLKMKGGETDGKIIQARLMKKSDTEIHVGDELILKGIVKPPKNSGNPYTFDYALYLRRQGISGTVFCFQNQWKPTGRNNNDWQTALLRFRNQLVDRYKPFFSGRDLAVMAALTLGDKTLLSREVRELFSETGAAHILALSGLHLGILFSIYNFFLLSFFRRRSRVGYVAMSFLGIVMMWAFVLLVGFPASLVRACVMYSIMQLAACFHRPVLSLNTLSLAAILMILVHPLSVFDVGFQLSFLSVLSILLLMPMFPVWKSPSGVKRYLFILPRYAYSMFAVSLCAIVGTAPLLSFYFRNIPLSGFFSSLVAVPLAYVIIIGAFFFLLFPFMQQVLSVLLGKALEGLFSSLEWFSSFSFSSLHYRLSAGGVVFLYLILTVIYMYLRSRKSLHLYFISALIILFTACEVIDKGEKKVSPQIVFYQNYSVPALHCIASQEESYLWSVNPEKADSSLSFVKQTFWKEAGLLPPVYLRSDTLRNDLSFNKHTLQFGSKRIGLLYDEIRAKRNSKPLPVDFLFVTKGCHLDLEEMLSLYRPEKIVLDAGLQDYFRESIRLSADSLQIDCHDLDEDGALIIG